MNDFAPAFDLHAGFTGSSRHGSHLQACGPSPPLRRRLSWVFGTILSMGGLFGNAEQGAYL